MLSIHLRTPANAPAGLGMPGVFFHLLLVLLLGLFSAATTSTLVQAQTPPANSTPPLSKRGSIDIDGNGKSVLLVRTPLTNNSATPQMQVGRLVGDQFQFTTQADPGANFRVVGVTDYDGNGKSDLVLQNISQGEFGDVHLWTDFSAANSRILRQVKQVWDVQVVGDLDGDGKGDLVWRYVVPDSPDTGVSYIWFSNGNNPPIVRKRGGAPLNWKLLGAADLNGDGAADMVYISPDNQIRVLMATANRTCANMTAGFIPAGFTALAFADFTGRKRGDVLIRNNIGGQVALLSLDATGIPLPVYTGDPDDRNASCTPSTLVIPSQPINLLTNDPSWRFYAVGDYDGNGVFDVVWLKPDGTLALWLMGGANAQSIIEVRSIIQTAGSTAVGFAATSGTSTWSPVGGSGLGSGGTNTLPTVSLTAPATGATLNVGTTVNIAATAADSDGTVAKVEFFANGTKLGEDTAAPYNFAWTPATAGTFAITARATDDKGATTTSAAVSVTVTTAPPPPPPPPMNQAPTVAITAPANNVVVTTGTTVNIAATAADSDGTVAKVEFFANGTKLGEDTAAPYNFAWTPATAGTFAITARATDDKGATTTSAAVSVTVTTAPPPPPPPPMNQAPTVAITAPANNVVVTTGTTVNIAATAADSDGTVAKVEFFANGTKLGEDTAAPYNFAWTPATAGTFAITARATDDKGATTTSAAVSVTVTVAAPTGTTIWKPLAIGAGGFITGISLHPDGQTRVIRTDTYGGYVWRGNQWAQLVTEQSMPPAERKISDKGVVDVVVAPGDAQRLYMLFDDRFYRSANQGLTWLETNFVPTPTNANDEWRTSGARIAVDPANADIVYVGTPQEGLRLTLDSGSAWQTISSVPRGVDSANAGTTRGLGVTVWFDGSGGLLSGRTRNIYAASWGNGIWRSTDAGAVWTKIAGDGGTPTNVSRADVASEGTLYVATTSAVWRFRGGIWLNISPAGCCLQSVTVDPTNANRIYAFSWGGDGWRSINGGLSWTSLTKSRTAVGDIAWHSWTAEDYMSNADVRFDPLMPGKLWFAQGIGVWRTQVTDTTSNIVWQAESRGIEQLVMNDIVAPPGGKPVSAAWDRATFVHENPDAFPIEHGPTSRFNSAWQLDWSTSNPSFIVANTSDHRFCCQQDGGAVQAGWSSDGGRTWTRFASLPMPAGADPNNAWRFAFGNIAVAANDTNNIVWLPSFNGAPAYTTNRGVTWNIIALPGQDANSPGAHFGYFLNRKILTADKVLPNTFYLAHPGGANGAAKGLWRSSDGGASWTRVYSEEITSYSIYNATLKAVPTRAGQLYFTPGPLEGGVNNPLMRSQDGGATWQAVGTATSVAAFGFGKPLLTGGYPTIYIAGQVSGAYGLWRSTDQGATWASIGTYPFGNLNLVRTIDGDKDRFGVVYLGFAGSGAAYGVPNP